MLEGAKSQLPAGNALTRMAVYTKKFEGDFAKALTQIQKDNPSVTIGSYPKFKENCVMLSIEGLDTDAVKQVTKQISDQVEGYQVLAY